MDLNSILGDLHDVGHQDAISVATAIGLDPLVDFAGADLENMCLNGHDLTGADLHGAVLREAQILYIILDLANLREADLRQALLRNVSMQGADLTKADFRSARLDKVDLRGALFEPEQFKGSVFIDVRLDDEMVSAIHAVAEVRVEVPRMGFPPASAAAPAGAAAGYY